MSYILRSLSAGIIAILAISLAVMAFGDRVSALCVDDPNGKTAVRLHNLTRYDLVFKVDEIDKGIVLAQEEGQAWEVEPGDHLLVAGANINGNPYWLWVENDIPKGQVCTWTIVEREPKTSKENDPYLSIFGALFDQVRK